MPSLPLMQALTTKTAQPQGEKAVQEELTNADAAAQFIETTDANDVPAFDDVLAAVQTVVPNQQIPAIEPLIDTIADSSAISEVGTVATSAEPIATVELNSDLKSGQTLIANEPANPSAIAPALETVGVPLEQAANRDAASLLLQPQSSANTPLLAAASALAQQPELGNAQQDGSPTESLLVSSSVSETPVISGQNGTAVDGTAHKTEAISQLGTSSSLVAAASPSAVEAETATPIQPSTSKTEAIIDSIDASTASNDSVDLGATTRSVADATVSRTYSAQNNTIATAVGNTVKSAILIAASQSDSRIQVELDPPELGTVRIELSKSEAGISAKIVTEIESTSQLLQDHLTNLKRSLEETGVTIQDFNFSTQSENQGQQEAEGSEEPTDDPEGTFNNNESRTLHRLNVSRLNADGAIDVIA